MRSQEEEYPNFHLLIGALNVMHAHAVIQLCNNLPDSLEESNFQVLHVNLCAMMVDHRTDNGDSSLFQHALIRYYKYDK